MNNEDLENIARKEYRTTLHDMQDFGITENDYVVAFMKDENKIKFYEKREHEDGE